MCQIFDFFTKEELDKEDKELMELLLDEDFEPPMFTASIVVRRSGNHDIFFGCGKCDFIMERDGIKLTCPNCGMRQEAYLPSL